MAKCQAVESVGRGIYRLEFFISSRVVSFLVRVGIDTPESILEEFKSCFFDIYHRQPENVEVSWIEALKKYFPVRVGRFISYCTPN